MCKQHRHYSFSHAWLLHHFIYRFRILHFLSLAPSRSPSRFPAFSAGSRKITLSYLLIIIKVKRHVNRQDRQKRRHPVCSASKTCPVSSFGLYHFWIHFIQSACLMVKQCLKQCQVVHPAFKKNYSEQLSTISDTFRWCMNLFVLSILPYRPTFETLNQIMDTWWAGMARFAYTFKIMSRSGCQLQLMWHCFEALSASACINCIWLNACRVWIRLCYYSRTWSGWDRTLSRTWPWITGISSFSLWQQNSSLSSANRARDDVLVANPSLIFPSVLTWISANSWAWKNSVRPLHLGLKTG